MNTKYISQLCTLHTFFVLKGMSDVAEELVKEMTYPTKDNHNGILQDYQNFADSHRYSDEEYNRLVQDQEFRMVGHLVDLDK